MPNTPENYDELYDFKTLFYDAFYTASRGTVTLIAPKLLNLQKIISSGTFQFDEVTVSNKRLHKALGFDRLVLQTGFQPQVMRLSWKDLELSIPVRDDGAKEFAGLNCLVTVSKNNRLQWIEDWAAHHVHRQGVEAILFFDNGSDAYSLADIAGTLSGIDGLKTFKVVSAPFKYGPHVRVNWRARAKFLQTALFNLARLSYLRESAATLIVDIDELVQTNGGKTVFDYTTGSLLGYTKFRGRHRYAISAKRQDVIRHKDHLHIDADDRGKFPTVLHCSKRRRVAIPIERLLKDRLSNVPKFSECPFRLSQAAQEPARPPSSAHSSKASAKLMVLALRST